MTPKAPGQSDRRDKAKGTDMGRVIVRIDKSKCVGAGRCVSEAPTVFDQDEDDGIVILLQEHPPAELTDKARKAAKLCPALAIEVEDVED